MASNPDDHWHATSFQLMVGPIPATFFLPLPILPFWHPVWFMLLSLTWMMLVVLLARKGLGVWGAKLIARRWLQGSHLPPRRSLPK